MYKKYRTLKILDVHKQRLPQNTVCACVCVCVCVVFQESGQVSV